MNYPSSPPESEVLTRTQVLLAMIVTAVLLLIVAKLWQFLGQVPLLNVEFTPMALLWGLGLMLGITGASTLIHRFWPAYRRSADVYLDLVIRPLGWPDLLWLGLLPGLSEELLFRGVMLPALGLGWGAIALSSLLFGVLHLSGLNQWPYMVWATFVGAILGVGAIVTGNLLVPVIAHILTNFVSGCVWKWHHQRTPSES